MTPEKSTNNQSEDIGKWIIFGLLVGTMVGIFLGNLPTGMIIGICLGILIGSIWPWKTIL